MIARTALAAAAALAIAAPATAATQLERTLGVEPGAYSTAELLQLRSAIDDNEQHRIEYILEQQGRADAAATRSATSLTTAERTVIGSALENNDFTRARFVAENGLDTEADVSDAGKAQLATSLGVDPVEHSLAELVVLRNAIED